MSGWAGWQSSAAFAQGLSSAGSSVVDSEVASRVPTQPSQYFLQGEFGASAAHSLRPAEDSHSTLSVQPPAPQQESLRAFKCLRPAAPPSHREEQDLQQQREREIARKQQTALRRGLFCARDLFDWQGEDYPLLDKVCVVRFPPEIAATLRQRLINAATAATSPEGTALACPGADLGLSFTPRPDFNHRIFDVKVSGHHGRLRGVLVELPALVEAYKCIDGDLLYKSGDISQMLYVYESTCDSLNLRLLCDQQQWEWLGGLTPPTHRIRSRKFRNLDLFDRHEIRDAELEALQMLHSLRRDFFELQVNSEWQMIEEQAAVQQQRQREKQGNRAAAATKGDRVERVISASEDINEFLALVREDESAASDASDVLFDDDALQQQQMNKLQKQLAQTQSAAGHSLAGGRMSDIGKAGRRGARGGGGAGSTLSGSTSLAFGAGAGATDGETLCVSEEQQQLLLLKGLGVPAPSEALAFGEALQDSQSKEERRRLRRERRKQKKAQKKAKKEMRMQQQQQLQQNSLEGLSGENADKVSAVPTLPSGPNSALSAQLSSSLHVENVAQMHLENDALSSADSGGDDF